MIKLLSPLVVVLATVAVQAAPPAPEKAPQQNSNRFDPWEKRLNAAGILELEWDDLAPADFDPDTLFAQVARKYHIKQLSDSDPRAKEIQAEIQRIWNHAPTVASLNGRRVRLPGLVVPLEGDGKAMSEFLLVPYYGACIHVPPPPSNQIVYVRMGKRKAQVEHMFDALWVTGKLVVEHSHKEVGDASYTLEADKVEPYQ
jgi:hypothetical protein